MRQGPGHGIQLTSGRLLIPVWLSTGEGGGAHRPSCVTTLYSDDAGTTWQTGEIVVNHPTLKNPSESVAVQLKNGVVMLNIRNENPERRRAVAFSRDGAGGWTRVEFVEQLYEPTCMASSIRYPHPSDKQRSLVLFANPDSRTIPANQRAPGGRQRLTVRLSSDDARTWPLSRVLEEGPSGYSDLAQQGDGSVLCFYERSPKGGSAADPQALTLARFNLDWLARRERRAEKNKKDGN